MKGHHGHRAKHARTAKHAGSGKHRPVSAAEAAAWKKWQEAGSKASAAKRHAHAVAHGHHHAKPSHWSPLDDVSICAAEAVAASARLAGRDVSDADVLALYWLTADHADQGATLWDTIEAAGVFGLGGARLVDARPTGLLTQGVVLAADLQQRHAMTADGHGVWTWGQWRPASCSLLAAADEAWELTWLS